MKVKGCFSHKTDNWATPHNIYEFWVNEENFYDPCPLMANFNGLNVDVEKSLFINPPYSDISSWVEYAIKHLERHKEQKVVMLLPVRTDRPWFAKLIEYNAHFLFIDGRLKFGESKDSAPFPSMFVLMSHNQKKCRIGHIKSKHGDIEQNTMWTEFRKLIYCS